jgi:hypothetical protein
MNPSSRNNRFRTFSKNTELNRENSLFLSPQMSTDSSTKRFKLVPLFTNQDSPSFHRENNV